MYPKKIDLEDNINLINDLFADHDPTSLERIYLEHVQGNLYALRYRTKLGTKLRLLTGTINQLFYYTRGFYMAL